MTPTPDPEPQPEPGGPWPADSVPPAVVMSVTGPDGASPQRTRLAWRRTTLSHTVCALLLLRLATNQPRAWLAGTAGALTALGWLAAMALSQRRIVSMAERVPALAGRTMPIYAMLLAGYALLGVALVALD